MGKLQKETIAITKTFSTLNKPEYQFMDLVEEVGELSTAIMYYEKFKTGKLTGKITKDEISDALADILCDLFMISEQYNIDLEEEYKKMLKRLKKRIDAGEYKK